MADQIGWSAKEQGLADVEEFFIYAGYKARDMREPLRESADHITWTIAEEFKTRGAGSGGWVPLAEDYRAWKEKHAPGDPMLELDPALLHGEPGTPRTHKMRDALLDPKSWHITMKDAEYLPLSTRAAWHQEGADRSRGGKLPARPVLWLTEADYEEIEQIFWEWLDELRTVNIRRGLPDASIRPGIFG